MKRIPQIAGTVLTAALLACGGDATPPDAPAAVESNVVEVEMEEPEAPVGPDPAAVRERAATIFGELPDVAANPDNPVTDAKVALGATLYFDPRLSKNHDISCNSCHDLARFGVDGEPTSPGHRGQRGGRNSPTVYNAAFHVAQFWDGRAADVEEQAKGPVLNPIEMAMPSEEAVLTVLNSIPGYPPLFRAAFPEEDDPVTYDNLGRAIGAFERTLVTPSRFDVFLDGENDALNADELEGLFAFIKAGCVTCHMGPTVGGTTFQKLGAVKPYETADAGRFDVTGDESDRHVFKVPSLRNIAETGPYFHDGSVGSLDQAIRLMGDHQLGRTLSDADVASIRAFLESLTGSAAPDAIQPPELPKSGPGTPAPDPA
jgi:cytochrome c peroxidase